MTEHISPEQARAALDRAAESNRRMTRERVRFWRIGDAMMAWLFAAVTLAWGLAGPFAWRLGVTLALLAVLIAAAVFWTRQERAIARTVPMIKNWTWNVTALIFLLVIIGGDAVEVNGRDMFGRPLYWIPGALLVATPVTVSVLRRRA